MTAAAARILIGMARLLRVVEPGTPRDKCQSSQKCGVCPLRVRSGRVVGSSSSSDKCRERTSRRSVSNALRVPICGALITH